MTITERTDIVNFPIWLEFDTDDGVWISHVPALNDLSTFASTKQEAIDRTREAIVGYITAARKEGIALPSSDPLPLATEILNVAV